MANYFTIVLAENKQVFQPGETISGTLLLNTNKEIKLRSVRVELHGLGEVRIRVHKFTYERKETYLDDHSILLGERPSRCRGDIKLQPGDYKFPFQFLLPPRGLPTSFKDEYGENGEYGSVSYQLKAVVERSGWKSNLYTYSSLLILERVEIRDFRCLEPCVKREDRMLGWRCCPTGQLYVKARINRRAYCPGQQVKISGNISNESGRQVVGTEVQLVQTVLFKANYNSTRMVSETIYVDKNERRLGPGEETSVEFDPFVIPSVHPTTWGYGCIDISYKIRFIVRVVKAFDTNITFPVVITTVPPSSVDPALSQEIYKALANYLVSRAAARLANDNAEAETEARGQTSRNESGTPIDGSSGVRTRRGKRSGSSNGRPYQY
ncbi:arrestin domain-containing protein 4-like isoform X2 [Oculina patagonica]